MERIYPARLFMIQIADLEVYKMSKFYARSYALVVALAIFGANPCPAAESFPLQRPRARTLITNRSANSWTWCAGLPTKAT
jgi:hypothetical protein